jgi:eukaryotic-like serine/threonine-protein kinase
MRPGRWRQVDRILQIIIDCNSLEREALLDLHCGHDASVRREVESLLSSHDMAGEFMRDPPSEMVVDLLMKQDPEISVGESLGAYKIAGIIGQGGMGEVYSALDTRLRREVAIKVLPRELSSDAQWLKRFEREAQTASAINHPNIITIYDIGKSGSTCYLVMELVHGRTLRHILKAGSLPVKKLLHIAIQIAEGLAKVHCAGITHRDLKPENIMITDEDLVKILDFGLAIHEGPDLSASVSFAAGNSQRMVEGTVGYMSPEQKAKCFVNFQADQYSFGAILYEMATGLRAFPYTLTPGTLPDAVDEESISLDLDHPGLSESLRKIVERCLSTNPGSRYACTRHLLRELQTLRNPLDNPSASGAHLKDEFDSIAVLSFANATGKPDMDFLCIGLAEGILDGLRTIPGLHVTPRSSAFSFRGQGMDLHSIAEKLEVRLILNGSLMDSASGFRIEVRLVEASEEYELWTHQYDFGANDGPSVQEQIILSIAQKIRGLEEYTPGFISGWRVDLNPTANTLYLKAKFYLRTQSAEGLRIAVQCLEEALKLEPNSAPFYDALAECHIARGNLSYDRPRDCFRKAKEYAMQALSLASNDPGAFSALLAIAVYYYWDFELADQFFEHIQGLRPCDPHAILGSLRISMSLAARGLFEEAILRMSQVLEIDPFSLNLRVAMGFILYMANRLPEAGSQLETGLELDELCLPANLWLSAVLAEEGRMSEALARSETAVSLNREFPLVLANHARILALSGDSAKAFAILNQFKSAENTCYVPSYHIAAAFCALERADESISYLKKALIERSGYLLFLPFDPAFGRLHQEPQFQAFLSSLPIQRSASES